MSAEFSNITSDAIADPPRSPDRETNSNEQIRIEEQRSKKTPPNPETGSSSDNRNHQRSNRENASSASEDRDSIHERKRDRKPKRTSRRNSSKGLTISNVVISSNRTEICNQTQININKNGVSTSHKYEDKSGETNEASKKMPQHILNLTECQATITNQDKLATKMNIGENWEKVAYSLPNLKEIDLKQCLMVHSEKDITEKMYQILSAWHRTCGKLATIGALTKVLWDAEEYICAEALAILHKPQ